MELKELDKLSRFAIEARRILMGLERQSEPHIRNALSDAYTNAADIVEKGGGANAAVSGFRKQMERLLYTVAQVSIPVFGERGVVMAGADRPMLSFNDLVDRWMQEHGLRDARMIEETTRDTINGILFRGVEDGKGAAEIARDVRKQGAKGISAIRARTIAITETHNASTYAQAESAKAIGVDLLKRWVPVEDMRTRVWHAVMWDDTYKPMSEPYIVGGKSMMRPGDPAGGGENVINCRCVEIYKPADF